ncbi:MAG: Unknown protein [uncultured Sulfurovum sp.]|uniref:DUF4276 family protein n=1 Tax=uncultured Sulfurovum sp. TaxID=269237 RepID=A0A6S6RUF8_9BACT|nr:MAG: Unknown protein [uncultured Sulfurovum sp.]
MVMIIVEGNDDKNFLVTLLNDLKKKNEINVSDSINFNNYIEVMGSKSKLLNYEHSKYQKLSMKIGNDVQKVLFMFDCDFEEDDQNCNGIQKSEECFDVLLKNLEWDIEIDKSKHLHIFDKNLDYFLLETINTKECYECFDKLVKCLEVENLKPNKKPIANLYRDLYPYPQFAFEDNRFNPLKQKLKNLFEGNE